MTISAILLAGGRSERFHPTLCKQEAKLGEKPVYLWAYDTMLNSALFDEILIVGKDIPAGKTRQESSLNGILAAKSDYVLIHDGARPFVSRSILEAHVEAIKSHDAINTCIPTTDTINCVKNQLVQSIPKRSEMMLGQTPQTFLRSLILKAHENTLETNATDDCSLVHMLGYPVFVVEGEQQNFKITTSLDLAFAKNNIYTESI